MPPPAAGTITRLARALGVHADELLLLADKVPSDIRPVITRSPTLPAFLRSISDLNEDEIAELKSYAQQMRARRKTE